MDSVTKFLQPLQLHPVVDHFSMALLIVAVLIDLVASAAPTRIWLRYTALLLIILGALAAGGSYFTGGMEADRIWNARDLSYRRLRGDRCIGLSGASRRRARVRLRRRHRPDGGRSSSVGSRESFVGAHFLGSDSDGVRSHPDCVIDPAAGDSHNVSIQTDGFAKAGQHASLESDRSALGHAERRSRHVMQSKQVEGPR